MYKRGQVTIFIILGIVVIAILAFLFFIGEINFEQQLTQEESERFVSVRLESVRTYVEDCVEENSFVVLKNMGRQGGRVIPDAIYYDVPLVIPQSSIIDYNLIRVNNRYINYNPSLSEMEAEFEVFLNGVSSDPAYPDGIGSCLENLKKEYKDDFSGIKSGDLVMEVQFEDTVRIFVKYPLTLTKSDYETTITDYYVELPVNMGEIHEVSSRMINSVISSDNGYLDEITKISSEYNEELSNGFRKDAVFVSSSHYVTDAVSEFNNEDNILFTLEYKNPELTQEYLFRFLVGRGSA